MEHQSTINRPSSREFQDPMTSTHAGHEGAEKAASYVQGAVEQTREAVAQATGYVQDTVDQARTKMVEYGQAGFERVKEDVVSYTRQQPVTALLIAAGAGLVLGMMTAITRK